MSKSGYQSSVYTIKKTTDGSVIFQNLQEGFKLFLIYPGEFLYTVESVLYAELMYYFFLAISRKHQKSTHINIYLKI
jgi:hypothetical protein